MRVAFPSSLTRSVGVLAPRKGQTVELFFAIRRTHEDEDEGEDGSPQQTHGMFVRRH